MRKTQRIERTMLTSTRRRQLKQAIGDGDDMISNLPDVLLTRILSFLSTKEAVRTGILSTRWKSIWASVPKLDLSEEDFGLDEFGDSNQSFIEDVNIISREDMFRDFVDSTLVGHKMPFLEIVAISGPYFNPSDVESWISAAIVRNVRKLELSVCFHEPTLVLPQSLFSCYTLVVLKLGMRAVLNFPVASTCFPNLKVLELSLVIFKDDNSARNLISGCPVLEDLVIIRDQFNSLQTLNVSSRSLKSLSLDYSIPGDEFVPKILFDAPALESIDISDYVTHVYEVKDLSSLIKASLNVSNFASPFPANNYALCLFAFLGRITNVKCLSISSCTMESLFGVDSSSLPTFRNLTSLKFFDFSDYNWNWKLVMKFLKSSPKLEVLIFEGFSFSHQELGNWEHDVPSCLVSRLKTIKIRGFLGKCEAEKVSYFLKNAKVLEKMTVETTAVEELLNLPRGSTTCEVEFR